MPTKERYEQQKKNGVCVTCGKQHESGSAYCKECLEKRSIKYRKHKNCNQCGVDITFTTGANAMYCPDCAYERNLGSMRDWYKNLTPEKKEIVKARQAEWQRNRRAKNPKPTIEKAVAKRYGVDFSLIEDLYNGQGGLCAICGKALPPLLTRDKSRDLHIDHCHATNQVRGVLCRGCNHGLGNFKDNPQFLKAAIEYLERNNFKDD